MAQSGGGEPERRLRRNDSGFFAISSCAVAGMPVARTLMTEEYSGAAVTDAMNEFATTAIDVA